MGKAAAAAAAAAASIREWLLLPEVKERDQRAEHA
jgi:hypothetical protein